jgi:hypothetical protein
MGGVLLQRLRDYKDQKGPRGESHDLRNLSYWENRASQNSDGYKHRALDGPVQLHSTGGPVDFAKHGRR